MKPVSPWSTISGTEPQRQATTGVPQAMASIITRPNGSGQSIGNSSAWALPRNADFSRVADLAHELDQGIVEQRLDDLAEVGRVRGVDLGRDLQRQARALGDGDRPVRALLRRDPAEEGQIGGLLGRGREGVERSAASPCGMVASQFASGKRLRAGRRRSRPAG